MRHAILSALLLLPLTLNAQEARVTGLQTEYLTDPLGIDTPQPRLGWRLEGMEQASYALTVGTDSLEVLQGRGNVWQTSGDEAIRLVTYRGAALRPMTAYYWKVTVRDSRHKTAVSRIARFETGKMSEANWQGAWISDSQDRDLGPAPYFRKEFQTRGRVRKARAYIAAAGLMELTINGVKIGDHFLDPVYTRFDRRNLYLTHDVTKAIQSGQNAIGVVLGNGWYNHQSIGVWDFEKAPWRNRPTFVMDLHLWYEDGSDQVISTDLSWTCSDGALIFNSIYTGEHYDFSKERQGWDLAGFDEAGWKKAIYRQAPSAHMTSQAMVPIRKTQEFQAAQMRKFSDSDYLFDFRQNMAGIGSIRLKGKKGTQVKLIYAERLGKDGHVDQSNIDVYFKGDREKDPYQTDILYLSGQEDQYETRFNYKGFRYIEVVSDEPVQLTSESLKAHFVHSDVSRAGQIRTSDALITGMVHATEMAYLSNLMGYPTDCPQREKNGWTGDGHLAIETALYSYDGITVYEKWMRDHRDEQQPNGVLPDIVPTDGWGYGTSNGLDWTSTIAIIPWNLYLFYGDKRPLEENYEAIKRYVDYVERHSRNHLTSWGRGDWVPVSVASNLELTCSCYFFKDATILSKAAEILGRKEDAVTYARLAEEIKKAVNDKYLDYKNGIYASGTQTELSVPLHWGLVPEDMKALVAENLDRKVREAGYHLDVGVLGSKALLNALKDAGYDETAYRVAVQDTYPSWGWWIVNGATTLLENWNLQATRDISDNHMMFGEIGAYFYKGLGGIYPSEEEPGFHHIILRPYFPKDLKDFEATHESPYGIIRSAYTIKGKKVVYEVTVPSGCGATLTLPSQIRQSKDGSIELKAGVHTFHLDL